VFDRIGFKSLPGTNTSLFQKFVNYGQNKFYNIGPWLTSCSLWVLFDFLVVDHLF
jgi:hypothetical protein